MLDGLWKFIKRHRRKIFVTGAVVGGILLIGRYTRKKLKEFQDHEATQYLAQIRKQHHFESNQRTCDTTVLSMIPPLRDAIIKNLYTEELAALLKTKPDNKLEIWAELKVKSFTRMFASVYASCILVAVLRVRLNIIGGYMFIDHMVNSRNGLTAVATASSCLITEEIQREYLQQIHYVLDKGLDDLVHATLKVTEDALSGLDLQEQVSILDVDKLVKRVRREMEHSPDNSYCDRARSALCRFMMPHSQSEEVCGAACREKVVLDKLNHETRDIIENTDFAAVLTLCLDRSFSLLLDNLTEYFDQLTRSVNNDDCLDPSMPLAKLIPIVDRTVHVVLADMPNSYIKDQLLLEEGKDFAANVYEAFTHVEIQTAR